MTQKTLERLVRLRFKGGPLTPKEQFWLAHIEETFGDYLKSQTGQSRVTKEAETYFCGGPEAIEGGDE